MRCTSATTALPTVQAGDTVRADERAGDRDRQRTADVLALATAQGHLRIDELDERLAAVWSATPAGRSRTRPPGTSPSRSGTASRTRPPAHPWKRKIG